MKLYQILNISFIGFPFLVSAYYKSVNSLILEPILSPEYYSSDLNKRDEEIECEFTKAFLKCKEAIDPDYNYCMKDYEKILAGQYDHKNNCPAAMSEKCKALYREGHAIKEECRAEILKGYVENEKKAFTVLSAFLSLVCTKDEDDQYCAYNDIIIEEEPVIQEYEKTLYEIVNSTCYSKSCTEKFVDFYDHVQEYLNMGMEYAAIKSAYETQSTKSGVQNIIESNIEQKIKDGEIVVNKKKKTKQNQKSKSPSSKTRTIQRPKNTEQSKGVNQTKNTQKQTKISKTNNDKKQNNNKYSAANINKRSFAIENMSKLKTNQIYNKTLQYLKSEECHNYYVQYLEQKNLQTSRASTFINPISIYFILYSVFYLLL